MCRCRWLVRPCSQRNEETGCVHSEDEEAEQVEAAETGQPEAFDAVILKWSNDVTTDLRTGASDEQLMLDLSLTVVVLSGTLPAWTREHGD